MAALRALVDDKFGEGRLSVSALAGGAARRRGDVGACATHAARCGAARIDS